VTGINNPNQKILTILLRQGYAGQADFTDNTDYELQLLFD
jgi:hypothetical protein